MFPRSVGSKSYELTDHLGNVKAVVSDRKVVADQAPEYTYRYGFESDQDQPGPPTSGWSWTFSTDPDLVYRGKRSTGVTGHAHAFVMDVQPGDTVSAEVMMKFTTGTRGGYLYTAYQDANGQNEIGSASHLYDLAAHERINEWSRIYRPQHVVPAGKYKLIVYLRVSQSSGQSPSWFDDFKISVKRGYTEPVLSAEVLSANSYYAFGSLMPKRSFNSSGYRYGFNGMEKDDEIAGSGNSYTAEFWQYDSRLGRRWNQDPKPNPSISNYAVFAGNPILYSDPLGDTIHRFRPDGTYLDAFDDGKETISGLFYTQSSQFEKDGKLYNKYSNPLAFEFNDYDLDRTDLQYKTLNIIGDSDLKDDLVTLNERKGDESTILFMERESRPEGHASWFSGISKGYMDPRTSFPSAKGKGGGGLFLVKGINGKNVAFNFDDYGNFLWGMGGANFGYSKITLRTAAHINNAVSGNDQNIEKVPLLDSEADQRAIGLGVDKYQELRK